MPFPSTDVDECERDVNLCDKNALCTNSDGSYTCSCNDGYLGNGQNCSGNGGIEKVGGQEELKMQQIKLSSICLSLLIFILSFAPSHRMKCLRFTVAVDRSFY